MRLRSFIPSLGHDAARRGQAGAEGVLIDKSEIRFVSRQMGVNVEGRFRRWKANIVFLPKDLANPRPSSTIELGSIDLASDESETEVKRPKWFDTAKFPVAKFVSTTSRISAATSTKSPVQAHDQGHQPRCRRAHRVDKGRFGQQRRRGCVRDQAARLQGGRGRVGRSRNRRANEVTVRIRMVLPPVK